MKYIITLLIITSAIIIACKSSNKSGLISKPGNMPADEYVINIDKDTTLVTKNGAYLKIPKGALSTTDGNTVTLEIKEAYSLKQMIRYGLTTTSNGEALSSGGMIYINAKGGQEVKITQAIKVAIPTNSLSPEMNLYKGATDAEGNINWTDPTPLPENKQLTTIEQGRQLFESRCASCHSIGKDMTGPNLAHFQKRFPMLGEGDYWEYYQHGYYLPEEAEYAKAGRFRIDTAVKYSEDYFFNERYFHPDPYPIYKCNLISQFGVIGPVLFSDSNNSWLVSVHKYIQNESDRKQLPLPAHAYLKDCADSCAAYQQRIIELQQQKKELTQKRHTLVAESPQLTEEIKNKTGNIPEPAVDFDDLVSPENNKGVYYQFTIETFGWYNVDILLSAQFGNQQSELFVRVVGEYRERFDIFLIIPSNKIYVKGGKGEDNSKYAFGFKDGKIFLPQNSKAYIMAVSESSSSVAFVLKEFTTSTKDEMEVELKAASKEEFNLALNKVNAAGDLRISVKNTKNADSIRKTDADLKTIDDELKKAENLKPKNCDCNCVQQRPAEQPKDSVSIFK